MRAACTAPDHADVNATLGVATPPPDDHATGGILRMDAHAAARAGPAMDSFKTIAEYASLIIDFAGVVVIVLGLLYGLVRFVHPPETHAGRYRQLRQDVGRGILLGLEFMVAGDIIRTVAIEPTLDSVLVLALIVVVRTFLSMSLEVELEGQWPWHRRRAQGGDTGTSL